MFGDKSRWIKSKVVQGLDITGIGKYAHISILSPATSPLFDYGEVFVGKSVEKTFTLENQSIVPANFSIKRAERQGHPYFDFSMTTGTVPIQGRLDIKVSYSLFYFCL